MTTVTHTPPKTTHAANSLIFTLKNVLNPIVDRHAISIQREVVCDDKLNEQERNYLLLIANGYTFPEAGGELELDEVAAKRLQHAIHQKLGCNNDCQAIYKGIRYASIAKTPPIQAAFLYLLASGYRDADMVEPLQKIDTSITEASINNTIRTPLYQQLQCQTDPQLIIKAIVVGMITGLNQLPDV